MAIAGYQYRVGGGAWVDAEGATVSLTGLTPGVRFAYQVRAKDAAGNFSEPSAVFYATTPYQKAMLALEIEGVLTAIALDSGEAIEVLYGENLYGRA